MSPCQIDFRGQACEVGLQDGEGSGGNAVVQLFLDGTCKFHSDKDLRFAAWAVCRAGSSRSSLDNTVLLGGHLSGILQSAG